MVVIATIKNVHVGAGNIMATAVVMARLVDERQVSCHAGLDGGKDAVDGKEGCRPHVT